MRSETKRFGGTHSTAERARAVGAWGAVAGVAAASGPVLGGVLSGLVTWRAVFFVNLPVGIVGLALSARYLAKAGEALDAGLDPPGQLLAMLALTLLAFGMIEAGNAGWSSAEALVPLAAFLPASVAFILVEHRTHDPMLPLGLFRRPSERGLRRACWAPHVKRAVRSASRCSVR